MDLNQRLAFCTQCKKREFHKDNGLVCSLTFDKPKFVETCPDFEIDPKVVTRKADAEIEEVKSKSNGATVWIVIGVVLIIIRIILRMARD